MVPFHLDMPFDSDMPCILTLTFVKSPSKSDLLSERQYVEPESVSPSGNALTNYEALALIIMGRVVKHSASLSLDLVRQVFQATIECCWIVAQG
jgi:hypothetical protein